MKIQSDVHDHIWDDVFKNIFERYPYYDDTGDAFEFRVEIPGVKKENVKLDIKGDQIKISTLRKLKDKEERRSGVFDVPQSADLERAEASVEDGMLTVRLPKQQVASPRMIPIK